jgi:hypothetical protein
MRRTSAHSSVVLIKSVGVYDGSAGICFGATHAKADRYEFWMASADQTRWIEDVICSQRCGTISATFYYAESHFRGLLNFSNFRFARRLRFSFLQWPRLCEISKTAFGFLGNLPADISAVQTTPPTLSARQIREPP